MKNYQIGFIMGIGIICAAGIPLFFPRTFPNPVIVSASIALAGLIVLVIAVMVMIKWIPATGK
ncbi:MAG: hypothetical protein ACW98Y_11785 [Candidatus Thorarchaeota archaeon]